MASEIEKFDPSTLMQGVKDRIKATFVSLIPDEQWDQMCKREIDDFFSSRPRSYNNNSYSEFTMVVNRVLEEETKKKIKEIIQSHPDFSTSGVWNEGTVSESIKVKLIESAPMIFTRVIENMMASTIQQMKQY
jgi:hypothetical protein